MRATIMYKAGDVRVETVPDARIVEPTDALLRVTRACICGSDLWPYNLKEPAERGQPMGHEAIGIVEAVGAEVRTLKQGDLVVMPFAYSDGTCVFCREGVHTSCVNGGFFASPEPGGAQAEAVRIPLADGTLVRLPVGPDDALMPALLTLSDVMGTGHHAADGDVGLCGVIAARRLGAEPIIILGRRPDRIALAKEFGATHVVSERGDEAVERVRGLTRGLGVHSVLECVGTDQALGTAIGIARPGPHVPGRAASRSARGQDRARPGLRSDGRARRRSRRLPGDERPSR